MRDEESGEERPVEKSVVREVAAKHAPLVSLFSDMMNGTVHLTLTEYNDMNDKMYRAWRMFKAEFAEKKKRDQQGH